jgi:hypothetical protein
MTTEDPWPTPESTTTIGATEFHTAVTEAEYAAANAAPHA